jgi:ankyrin repeat protein
MRKIKTLLKPHPTGRTALHEAFFAGDFATLPPPLIKSPYRGLPDHHQTTPLHRAAEGGHLKTLHHLQPLQLQELILPNSHGETPLHLAPLTTIPEEFLNNTTLTLKTPLGQTPLHKAAEDGLLLKKIPHPARHLLELTGEDEITLRELLKTCS